MTGSLQIKRGKYYAVLNFKDKNGKRIPRWIPLHLEEKGNKKRAATILSQLIVENTGKEVIKENKNPLFTDYIKTWLELQRGRIENSTWESYESYSRVHIIPYFKILNLTVGEVTASYIKGYYDYKSKGGRCDKKVGGLSQASIKNHSKVLKQVLESAVIEEYVNRNVALKVPIPRLIKDDSLNKGVYLTAQQANTLLAAFQCHRLQQLLYVTLYYGLRRSEVLGLKWDSIDFENNTVSIKHVVVKTKTIEAKDRTKTSSSKRTYYLLPEIKEILLDIKMAQDEYKTICGDDYKNTNGYIFVWDDGTLYRPDFVTRAFQAQLKKSSLPKMRFHDLRHSTASILYDKGWSLKDISEWLGHADIETTSNIYTHISKERQKMMGQSLERTFSI